MPVRRQRISDGNGETVEIITFETPLSVERLKEEYERGNITVEELDQMLPGVLAAEEKHSRTIARHIPQEDGMDMETVGRITKGVVLGSVAVALFMVIVVTVLLAVAGLVAYLAQSI